MYIYKCMFLHAYNSLRLRKCCLLCCSQLRGSTLQQNSQKLVQMPLLHASSLKICKHHHRWVKI